MKTVTKTKSYFLSIFISFFCVAHAAVAAPIISSDFNDDQKQFVSFASLELNFFGTPGPVIRNGVAFTSGIGGMRTYGGTDGTAYDAYLGYHNICFEGCISSNVEGGFVKATLLNPVSAVGAYVGVSNVSTTSRTEFYAGDTLLGFIDAQSRPHEGVFVGWSEDSAIITSVKFIDTEINNFVIAVTGLTYQASPIIASVPEPSTYMSLFFGVVTITIASLKKKYN